MMTKNEKRTTAEFFFVLGVLVLLIVLTSVFEAPTSYGGAIIKTATQFLMMS